MNMAWSIGGSLLTAALMLPNLTHHECAAGAAQAPAAAPAALSEHCTHGSCPDSPALLVSPRRGPGGGRGFTPLHERMPCPTCHRPWPGGPGWSGPLTANCGCARAADGADARPLHSRPGPVVPGHGGCPMPGATTGHGPPPVHAPRPNDAHGNTCPPSAPAPTPHDSPRPTLPRQRVV